MRFVTELVQEETYTFTPNDGTAEIHILSGRLRKWLLAHAMHKVGKLIFPQQSLREIEEIHGLERSRMKSLTAMEAEEPVIVGCWHDGTNILIDGGHRRWYWAKRNRHELNGWLVPFSVWSEYMFDPTAPGVISHNLDAATLPHRRKP